MEKNKSGERKEIKEERKKKADYCGCSIKWMHRKVEGSYSSAQKAEESRRKTESGIIEQLS